MFRFIVDFIIIFLLVFSYLTNESVYTIIHGDGKDIVENIKTEMQNIRK